MCVTCYTPDPREVRLIEWLEKRQHSLWVHALASMLEGPPLSDEDASSLLSVASESTLDRMKAEGRLGRLI